MSNDAYTDGGCCGTQTTAAQIGGINDGVEIVYREEDGSWPDEVVTRNKKSGMRYLYTLQIGPGGIVSYRHVETYHVPIKRRKKKSK